MAWLRNVILAIKQRGQCTKFSYSIRRTSVEEKLCTEPKDNPNEALQFAIAFEDGLRRQKTYGYIAQEYKVKEEPVCTVGGSKQNDRECWRCGAGNFTLDHIKVCKAQSVMCNYCGRKGLLERVCNQKKNDNFTKTAKMRQTGKFEQMGRRVQLVDQDDEDEDDGNYTVLNVEGEEENSKPYFMEGFINGNRFKAMIDSGSPVTIFAIDELKRIMERETLQVRDLIKEEKYVDFNGKPLNLLGYVFCELQVGDSYIRKARVLVARKGYKSIIGRE